MANEQNETKQFEDEGTIKIGEALKKLLSVGLGAAFMTEESIRSYMGELKLPKDLLQTLLQGASKSKEELLGRVGNEVIRILSKIDFVSEATRFVEAHKFTVKADIEITKRQQPTGGGATGGTTTGGSADVGGGGAEAKPN